VKLNEFKKRVVNEIDARSLFGDYGAAALKTGLGSMAGKNVLSTTDQMAKDDYITKFTSRALSGLQSAINGGLVDPNAAGQGAQTTGQTTPQTTQTTPQTTQTTQQGELPSAADAIAQKRIAAQKAQADAIREPGASEGPKYKIDPNKQMSPFSKLPPATPKTPEQIRQEKLAAATQAAQGQMTPKVAGPIPKTPEQIRQEKLAAATQSAQGQMNPVSNLPADQFAKSADNVRQQQQTTATQTAQQQMAAPQSYQSSDPRYPNGKYDGVTGQPTPEYQKEVDKSAAAQAEKQKADAAASQAQAKSNDDMAANMNNIAAQRNIPDVTQGSTPNVSTGDDDERAALDKMKQKNPKLAGMMAQAGLDDNLNDIKPDNTVKMPKRNVKPRNAGKNAFGQMAQNLGKVKEGSRFDKLNYIFESILAEQDPEQGGTKQTISQYITNFFKQFMKNVDISDPTVMTNVASLAKELEQTYAKDKGKTTLPKLANLAYSVSYAQQLKDPEQAQTKQPAKTTPTTTIPQNTKPEASQASTQQAKMTATQITKLMQGLNTRQKQSVLKSLQAELGKNTQPTISVGKQKNSKKTIDPSDARLLAVAKQQGKL